jgi:hypothetical protein
MYNEYGRAMTKRQTMNTTKTTRTIPVRREASIPPKPATKLRPLSPKLLEIHDKIYANTSRQTKKVRYGDIAADEANQLWG